MVIKETYLSNLKNISRDAIMIRVARPSPLAPSIGLLRDWKLGRINWEEYTKRYINQIKNDQNAIQMMEHIKLQAETKDVYLYCYEKNFPCHRFILLEMLR